MVTSECVVSRNCFYIEEISYKMNFTVRVGFQKEKTRKEIHFRNTWWLRVRKADKAKQASGDR